MSKFRSVAMIMVCVCAALSACGKGAKDHKIRDDIDAYIEKNYHTSREKAMARQYARAVIDLIEHHEHNPIQEKYTQYLRAGYCLGLRFSSMDQYNNTLIEFPREIIAQNERQKSIYLKRSIDASDNFSKSGLPGVPDESHCD